MSTTQSMMRATLSAGFALVLAGSGAACGQQPVPGTAQQWQDIAHAAPDAVPSVLDLIPDDAALAVAVPNLERLKTRGDRLFEETNAQGLRLSSIIPLLYDWLGVKGLVDERRPAVALLADFHDVGVDESDPGTLIQAIVIQLPVLNLSETAKRFRIDEGALTDGRIFSREASSGWAADFVAFRNGYVLLASNKKALKSVLDGKTFASELSGQRRAAATGADIVMFANTHSWADGWNRFVQRIEADDFPPGQFPQREEIKQLLRQTVPDMQFVLLTATVDDGIHLRLAAHFSSGGTAEAALTRIQGGAENGANLARLPQGSLLGAISARGAELRTIATARLLAPLALQSIAQTGLLEESNPSRMLGILDSVRQQLNGVQMALYSTGATTTSQLSDRGMVAGLFVLQTTQPGRLIESIAREGITLGGDQDPENGPQARTRLKLRLMPSRERIAGHAIDHLEIDTTTIDADLAATLREGLGPAWMILRVVRLESEVNVLLGSETRLLAETLRIRESGSDDLAAGEPFTQSQSRLDAGHQAALYLSLQRTIPALTGFESGTEEMNSPIDRISSAALTVERNTLQIEFWLPLAEMKAIPEKWRLFW